MSLLQIITILNPNPANSVGDAGKALGILQIFKKPYVQ